ncbi:MAG: DUF4382 domain-containing protein [Pleurocapsa sp.]
MPKVSTVAVAIAVISTVIGFGSRQPTAQAEVSTNNGGILALVANGEDFVRQGFVSKDGWDISFDRVYVNLAEANAYQVESGFEPTETSSIDKINYQKKVAFLETPTVIDLAAGEADAAPILVNKATTDEGFYNAVGWKIVTAAEDSTIPGQTMVLQGKATKDGQTIDFNLGFNRPIEYLCGEYVGDTRKGIVQVGETAEVEATFHFDHIFGDNDAPADDALNVEALGFEPLANLASGNSLNLDESTMSDGLSPENYQKLTKAIAGLGHVGEGHCAVISNQ